MPVARYSPQSVRASKAVHSISLKSVKIGSEHIAREKSGLYPQKNIMKKCDYCGEEYKEYDLERIPTYGGRYKLMCYKCKAKGDKELHEHKLRAWKGIERKK